MPAPPVPAMRAIRQAIVKVLRDDSQLTTLLGGANRIYHRMRKRPPEARQVTYFDFGVRPDPTVPLRDRTFQIDVWDTVPERAANVADRIEALLDNKPMGTVGEGAARVVYLQLVSDNDVVADEGDLVRAILEFRVLAYKQG